MQEDRHKYHVSQHTTLQGLSPILCSIHSIQPPSLSSLKQVASKGMLSLISHGRISFSLPSPVYSAAKGNRNLRSGRFQMLACEAGYMWFLLGDLDRMTLPPFWFTGLTRPVSEDGHCEQIFPTCDLCRSSPFA